MVTKRELEGARARRGKDKKKDEKKVVYYRSKDDAKPVTQKPQVTVSRPQTRRPAQTAGNRSPKAQNTNILGNQNQKPKGPASPGTARSGGKMHAGNRSVTQRPATRNERKAAESAARSVINSTGKPYPQTGKSGLLSPQEKLLADTVLKRSGLTPERNRRARPKTTEELRNSIGNQLHRMGQNYAASQISVSPYDRGKLGEDLPYVQRAKQRFEDAKAAGDTEGMARAHGEAEDWRRKHGYSGGAAGDEYITAQLSQEDYNRLNPRGQERLTDAKLRYDQAATDAERQRIAEEGARIRRNPLYQAALTAATDANGRRMRGFDMTPEERARAAHRVSAGLASVGQGGAGSMAYLGQQIQRVNRDQMDAANMATWIRDAANYEQAKSDWEYIQDYRARNGKDPEGMNGYAAELAYNAAKQARAQLDRIQNDPRSVYFDPTAAERLGISTDKGETFAEGLLRRAAENRAEATEGLSGFDRFMTDALLSVGQSAPAMALSAIPVVGPELTLGVLGAQAAGQRAYDLGQDGVDAETALLRGLVSGSIEAMTERVPVSNWTRILEGRTGRNALKNILIQSGEEATEESVSYLANWAADKAARDPNAHLSFAELLENAGMGAVGGAVFGGAGSVIGAARRGGGTAAAPWREPDSVSPTSPLLAPDSAHSLRSHTASEEKSLSPGGPGGKTASTAFSSRGEENSAETRQTDAEQRQLELVGRYQEIRGRMENAQSPEEMAGLMSEYQGWQTEWDAAQQAASVTQPAEEETGEQDSLRPFGAPPSEREAFGGEAQTPTVENRAERQTAKNARRAAILARESRDMGQAGQEAILSAYDGREALGDYHGAFTNVYLQSLSGTAATEIEKPAALSIRQFTAAAEAGIRDRAAGLAAENRRAARAAGRNARAGVDWKDSYVRKDLDRQTARTIDRVAKALGVQVIFAEEGTVLTGTGQRANAEIEGNVVRIEKKNKNPVRALIGHELTHRMQDLSPESYRAFRDYVMSLPGAQQAMRDTQREYAGSTGKDFGMEAAMDELAADYAGELFERSEALQKFIKDNYENRTLLERVLEFFRDLAAKLTGKEKQQAGEAVRLLEEALKGAEKAAGTLETETEGQKNTAREGGKRNSLNGRQFAEDKYFARQMDRWDELSAGTRVKVGVVRPGSALNQVGLPAANLYFDVGKIKKAMEKHNDHLTPAVLKNIPDLLNDPIVICEYTGPKGNIKNTVNVYGNLFVNEHPLVVGVVMHRDINGNNIINNVRTVHARSDFAKQITDDSVLYLNEDKKKTRSWFHVCGNLNVPLDGTKYGLIRSIAFEDEKSKRFSLGGEKARTANVQRLSEARKMERDGKTEEEIRQATGWLKGPDGKWRFEITDEWAWFDSDANARGKQDYEEARDLWPGMYRRFEAQDHPDAVWDAYYEIGDVIRDAETQAEAWDKMDRILRDLKAKGYKTDDLRELTEAELDKETNPYTEDELNERTLADYLSHTDLFRAYPELKNMTFRFADLEKGTNGYFNPAEDEIVLNKKLTVEDEIMDTLTHEVQHAIQHIEGFASGASTAYWEEQKKTGDPIRTKGEQNNLYRLRNELKKAMDNNPEMVEKAMALNRSTPKIPRGEVDWDTLEQIEEDPPEWQEFDRRRDEMEEQYGQPFMDVLWLLGTIEQAEKGKSRSAAELYWQTAGEVEAREVSARREMDEEERRKTPPRLGGDDVVFAEGARFSISSQTESPEFKQWFGDWQKDPAHASKVVNDDGTPKVVYHQTGEDFTIFDPRNKGAGTSDNGTPFGIFLKSSDSNIGLRGGKQMALYANIRNPLAATNREDLARQTRKMSPEYSELLDQLNALDAEYHAKHEAAKQALSDFMAEWRKENPNAGRRALWDVPQFAELYDAEDIVVEEWGREADKLSRQAKETLTGALRENGYDGVILREDAGSFGRRTDAFIALDSEQVKSATDNVGTFDRGNRDIRYSVGRGDGDYTTIKAQLREHQNELNNMSPVANVSGKSYKGAAPGALRKDIVDHMKRTGGFVVDIPGFGQVVMDEKRLNTSLDYLDTEADAIAYKAIKPVLKHGKRIKDKDNHKGRGYGTVTFAAPVIINENRGNMAVVVKQTSKNYYKMHRVLTPEGKAMSLQKKADAESTPGGGITQGAYSRGEVAPPINSASEASVAQQGDEVNRNSIGASRAALLRENEILREKVNYWRSQVKGPERKEVDLKAVKKLAKEIQGEMLATMTQRDIADRLEEIYNGLRSDWSYDRAFGAAKRLAREIVEGSEEIDDTAYREYEALRKYFRTTPLVLSPSDREQITDYNDWRKRNMGRMRIKHGDTSNIDQVFQKAAYLWPEWFDEEKTPNPADQLEKIEEVLGDTAIRRSNPFADILNEAVDGLATHILEENFNLPSMQDYRDAELERMGRRYQERQKKAIERARENMERRMEDQRKRAAGNVKRISEQQQKKELRGQIVREAGRLTAKLLRGSDKNHIPKELRETVAEALSNINLSSTYMAVFGPDQKVTYVKNNIPEGAEPTKRTKAFEEIRKAFDQIRDDGALNLDPMLFGSAEEDTRGLFDQMTDMRDIPIGDLSLEQLRTMWQTIRAVSRAVTTYGKTMASEKYQYREEWAKEIDEEARTRRDMKAIMPKKLILDLETPYTFFSQLGEPGLAVYRMLRDAQDLEQRRVEEITEKAQKIADEKTVKQWKSQRHTFEVTWLEATEEGLEPRSVNLTLTTDQIMDLWLLSRRQQARDHLLEGGIVQPEIREGGRTIHRGSDAIRISEEMLHQITATLTQEQKEVAKKLQALDTGILAGWGNEAAMQAYGYEKFLDKDYWTIHTAKEANFSSVEKNANNPRSVRNFGLAKNTVPHANNPLDLLGAFDSFGRHAMQMITYATWLNPMEDAQRLYNWTFRDAQGKQTGRTIKSILNRVIGRGADDYWQNLMTDIQNGIRGESDTATMRLINKAIGNAKGAAVGANLRVVIQQPTAFMRIYAVMNPLDVAAGLAGNPIKGWREARQWAGIAARKKGGSFDLSAPGMNQQLFFGQKTALDRFREASGVLAGWADGVTWGAIWNAAKAQTARENPDMGKDSAEFKQRAAEIFTDVIDQTQVVDGVLQRSQIMRSGNEILKQATAFKGEPIMSLNLLLRSWSNWRYQTDPAKRTAARKAMGTAAAALVANAVVNALAQSVWDGIRDDDDDRRWLEGALSAFIGADFQDAKLLGQAIADGMKSEDGDTGLLQRIAENYRAYTQDEDAKIGKTIWGMLLTGNLAGNLNMTGGIPFVADLYSMAQGYDITRADADVIADVVKRMTYFIQSLEGDGKNTTWYAALQVAAQAGKLFGIPAHTIIRDVAAGLRTAAKQFDNVPLLYAVEKAIYANTSSKNKKLFEGIAWQALTQGDLNTFQHIRADLMEGGITDGKKMDNAMKKLAEANPDVELSQEIRDLLGLRTTYGEPEPEEEDAFGADDLDEAQYSDYAEERAAIYRPLDDAVTGMEAFRRMTDEEKDKTLKDLWTYADQTALETASGGQYVVKNTTAQAMAEAAEHEVTPAEYAILKGAANGIQSAKTTDGETISGSASVLKRLAMEETGVELTEAGREWMYEKLDISAPVRAYTREELDQAAAEIRQQEQGVSKYAKYGEENREAVKAVYEFKSNAKADVGPDGKTIRGSAKKKVEAEIDRIPNLTRAQKREIYLDMGYAASTCPW